MNNFPLHWPSYMNGGYTVKAFKKGSMKIVILYYYFITIHFVLLRINGLRGFLIIYQARLKGQLAVNSAGVLNLLKLGVHHGTRSLPWNSKTVLSLVVSCMSAKLSDRRSLQPLSVLCVHVLKNCFENNRIDDFQTKYCLVL